MKIVLFVAGSVVQFTGLMAATTAYRLWTTNHTMALFSAGFAMLFTVMAVGAAVMAVSKARGQLH